MKIPAISCIALAVLFVTGCGDSDSSDDQSACKASVCKDESTLKKCEGGVYREVPCGAGLKCQVNTCITAGTPTTETCTGDICKDSSTLKKCEGGFYREMPCGAGNKCQANTCIAAGTPTTETCTDDICKDSSTLKKCEGGFYREMPCGAGLKCQANACITDGTQTTETCTAHTCKDKTTLKICSGGVYIEQACDTYEECIDGACIPNSSKCLYHECTAELSEDYHACVNGSVAAETSQCNSGQLCLHGGCVNSFTEGDACTGAENSGYCTADKYHAVVCNSKHKLAIWTCADECLTDASGIVDCPKKARPKPHECEKDYKAECINNNSQVRLCKDYQIVTWDCYAGTCSVDANNTIYCPKTAGIAGLGGIESGGTYGDECNVKKYQEACIDKYYARICDLDGVVRIKPAGDCRISASNPLKVEYTAGAPCDTSDYMPFCINDGKAIGFCAYVSDDLSIGMYKAAHCPSCQTQADAEACMRL